MNFKIIFSLFILTLLGAVNAAPIEVEKEGDISAAPLEVNEKEGAVNTAPLEKTDVKVDPTEKTEKEEDVKVDPTEKTEKEEDVKVDPTEKTEKEEDVKTVPTEKTEKESDVKVNPIEKTEKESDVKSDPIKETKKELAKYEEECRLQGGKLLSSVDMEKYVCLQGYEEEKEDETVNSKNSVCFYANDSPYCIDSKLSNVSECNKDSKEYNFKNCMKNFIYSPIKLYSRLRTYPEKNKIITSSRLDDEECRYNNGVPLMKDINNYICLNPIIKVQTPNKEHCVVVNEAESSEKATYCIFQENTSNEKCSKSSKSYDYDKCNKLIIEYSNGFYAKTSKYE